MADGTQLNGGTGGDLIATDDLSTLNGGAPSPTGQKVQRVKVGYGLDGDLRDVSESYPLPILLRRDQILIQADVTGVTTSTTAYSAGDQVGAQVTLANAARVSGAGGRIVGVSYVTGLDAIGATDVVFFDASVTLAADNAAYAISDTDAIKVIAVVPLSTAYDLGANRIAQNMSIAVPYRCNGGTSLYASLITRVGHTFFNVADPIKLNVWLERD